MGELGDRLNEVIRASSESGIRTLPEEETDVIRTKTSSALRKPYNRRRT